MKKSNLLSLKDVVPNLKKEIDTYGHIKKFVTDWVKPDGEIKIYYSPRN